MSGSGCKFGNRRPGHCTVYLTDFWSAKSFRFPLLAAYDDLSVVALESTLSSMMYSDSTMILLTTL